MAWIAVDLVGTLVDEDELTGEVFPIPGAVETMTRYFNEGHRLTVFTSQFAPMPESERHNLKTQIEAELTELRGRIQAGHLPVINEGKTVCCYALSDKSWIQDPSGLPWETYRTMEDAQLFSGSSESSEAACCTPLTMATPNCCEPYEKTTGCCD